MTRKLMAFDLDGTLLFDGVIDPEDLRAVRDWQDAGHLAVLSSGKSIYATRQALDPFDIHFDHHVLYTGAVLADAGYTVTSAATIPTGVVARAVELFAERTAQINVYATTLDTPDALLLEQVRDHRTGVLVNPHRMDPADIPGHTFIGVPIWVPGDEGLLTEVHRQLLAEFPQVDVHRNQDFLDIVAPGASKGTGLARLLDSLDADLETYSIGDSWNDLEMHEWAGTSASFPHSPPEVRAATTTVVRHAREFIRSAL